MMKMTDEQRKQELHDKYKEQWNQPGEMDVDFRIAEKERDAEINLGKATNCLDNLLNNISLLSLDNDKLASFLQKLNEVKALVETEARGR